MPRNRYTLKSIEIAGFRGYREAKFLNLNARACLFLGQNRSGKTSTLGAIEWCLFEKFASLKGDKSGTLDELVNDHSQRAMVTLELQNPDGIVKIVRAKQRGTKKTKLEVTTPDGNVHKGNEARKTLYRLLGLEFDDFTHAVYLHQEDIRDLIVGDRDTRSAAMDRLLGLDILRNISEGLKPKPVRDTISKIQSTRDEVVAEIKGRLREAKKHLKEATQRAADEGLTSSRLSLEASNKISQGIFESLAKTASDTEIEVQKPDPATNQQDLRAHATAARRFIEKIRKQLPETKRISELTEKQTKIAGLKSEYAAAVSRYDIAADNVRSYVQQNGNEISIQRKIIRTKERIQKLEAELEEVGAKQKIIKYGLQYLDEFVDVKKCPICQRTINRDNVLEHLHIEARKEISKKLHNIDSKIKTEKEKKGKLEEILQELKRLVADREKALKARDEKIVEVASNLSRTIKTDEDIAALLDAEFAKIRRDIKKLEKPIQDRETKFSEIESWINQLLVIAEVLNKQQRLDKLFELQKSDLLSKVDEVLAALGGFEHTQNMVGDAVRELQTELVPSEVSKAMPAIRKIYKSLVAHPYYSEPHIEVEPSTRGALKNIYHIKAVNPKDGAETLVSQRFSTGDMNCTALSVFLGLAKQDAYSHRSDFLIIDDPSQNLDPERKEKLAEKLVEIVKERQLLVASQDEDFQRMLSKIVDSGHSKTFTFEKWNEKGIKLRGP